MCNKITIVGLDLFGLPFVAYHLTSCSLARVQFLKYNQFAAMLNLTNNEIRDSSDSISDIYTLASLGLSNNFIMTISKGCFMNLRSTTYL